MQFDLIKNYKEISAKASNFCQERPRNSIAWNGQKCQFYKSWRNFSCNLTISGRNLNKIPFKFQWWETTWCCQEDGARAKANNPRTNSSREMGRDAATRQPIELLWKQSQTSWKDDQSNLQRCTWLSPGRIVANPAWNWHKKKGARWCLWADEKHCQVAFSRY